MGRTIESRRKTPVAIRPVGRVGERVPEHVGPDSNQYGNQKKCEVAEVLDGQGAGAECHSLAEALGHPVPERFLCIPVKKPEDQEGEGKVEHEGSRPCVAESVPGAKCQIKHKIRRETADDDGGRYKTCAPERDGCCSMSEGKGHPERFDVMVPRAGTRGQFTVQRFGFTGWLLSSPRLVASRTCCASRCKACRDQRESP